MIEKSVLEQLYLCERQSMMQISKVLLCSPHTVAYWMSKHAIKRRSISDAVYEKSNPNGDPFKMIRIGTHEDAYLLGMGIGLYWGEGNKLNKHSVKLGNTDPGIIKTFIRFLVQVCDIDTNKIRYNLQIFSDVNPSNALAYWMRELNEPKDKFNKVTITRARSIGTYKNKNQTGVLTVCFHNYKLRDIIVKLCREDAYEHMPR